MQKTLADLITRIFVVKNATLLFVVDVFVLLFVDLDVINQSASPTGRMPPP